ncbi:hypothetical protein AAE478_000662 [Parahypoxylon ruwenzoriense]
MAAGNRGLGGLFDQSEQVSFKKSDVAKEDKHHMINAEGYMAKGQQNAMNKMLEEDIKDEIAERYKHDPTYPAMMHGNEPSRGAKTDAEIQREEEELLRKKKERRDSMSGKKS